MARIPYPEVPEELEPRMEAAAESMGFSPNDGRLMSHRPELMDALSGLVRSVYLEGELDPGFKRLIGLMASAGAGCTYCQAHTMHGASAHGVADDRITAVWDFETSALFTDAERAALRVGLAAGQSPNATTDEMFADMRRYWSDPQIVEIVAVISMFGFLNRWNSTLATDLEPEPAATQRRLS